jgi:hypothetical protein
MRDNYLGYAIDYSSDRDGYRVMVEDEVVYETTSYDDACIWAELQAERRAS